MAVTVQQFRLAFPEFNGTPESLVVFKLAEAVRRVNATVWGDLTDDGVRYLAAHLISIQPRGESARKSKMGPDTRYYDEYKRLMRQATAGYRVT